jgi:soluble lytic murein transglycosylase-like protein
MFHRVLLGLAALALAFITTPVQAQNWAELYAQGQAVAPGHRAMPRRVPLPVARSSVIGLIQRSAQRHGVPVRLAIAVSHVESRHRCNAVGSVGERGPMQIRPQTARGLGYRGSPAGLTNCGPGLDYGMRHLAIAWRRCGTKAGAARLHNRGLASSCSGPSRYVGLVNAVLRRT